MTDLSPSPTPAPAPAGDPTPPIPSTTTNNLPPAAPAAYYEAFADEGLRANPSVQRYTSPEDLAKAYVNLEKLQGMGPERLIALPTDPNDAAAMREVYTRLGLPKTAADYKLVESLPEGASDHDKAIAGKLADKMHAAGVPAAFVPSVVEFINEETKALADAQTGEMARRLSEGTATLQKEWGAAYEPKSLEIGRLVNQYGTDALKAALGDPKGIGSYPDLAIMLGKVLDRMAEPNSGGPLTPPPEGEAAMTPAQAQGALAKLHADPMKARAFTDGNHPMHKAVVEEFNRLQRFAAGQKAT